MKIVIAHFTNWWVGMSGGMERVVCQFANAMCDRGHEVVILYLGEQEGEPFYPLDKRIQQINILFENGRKMLRARLPIWKRIHREIGRLISQKKAQEINTYYRGQLYGPRIEKLLKELEPDIVISCSPDSAKYVVLDAQCTLPVIEMTHVDPEVEFHNLSKYERKAIENVKLLQLPLAAGIPIAQTYFPDLSLSVIGNPVNKAKYMASPGIEKKEHIITGVGFVNSNKNWKLLAEAFAGLYKKYPEWKVEIWGALGPRGYVKMLQKYIHDHHMEKQFFLRGRTDHIDAVYRGSDIFAFPSKSEGFGMALSEAMAAGIPAVGLKNCNGVNSLITDGVNGYLTEPTRESFQEALEKLMNDSSLREKMGKAAIEEMKKYEPDRIWDLWEKEIVKITAKAE